MEVKCEGNVEERGREAAIKFQVRVRKWFSKKADIKARGYKFNNGSWGKHCEGVKRSSRKGCMSVRNGKQQRIGVVRYTVTYINIRPLVKENFYYARYTRYFVRSFVPLWDRIDPIIRVECEINLRMRIEVTTDVRRNRELFEILIYGIRIIMYSCVSNTYTSNTYKRSGGDSSRSLVFEKIESENWSSILERG